MQSDKAVFIAAVALLGMVVAVVWLGAPLLPAALGAAGAGMILYWRRKRPKQ